jgi:hypothetical protein
MKPASPGIAVLGYHQLFDGKVTHVGQYPGLGVQVVLITLFSTVHEVLVAVAKMVYPAAPRPPTAINGIRTLA